MSYTPSVNANTLTLYLGICATGRARASNTTLDMVSFGTIYAPNPGVTFQPSDVGMPIAIVGGGPVDALMPPAYFVQGALFHTTIAAYVSPTQVTLTAAPDTAIFNTGFATIILYRPCPMASDQANVPTQFQWNSSIAPGTADTMQFSVLNTFDAALGNDNPYIDRFGGIQRGQPVYLYSSQTGDVFGGYIDTLTVSSQPGLPGTPYCWSATCASWQGLAKRRVVPPAIPQVLSNVAGDVAFRTIVLDYLSDDGVSVTAPTGLPNITIACAVGANIGQLLDQVVSLLSTATSAYYWTSDAWRNFILATRVATAAPWDVSTGVDLFAGDTPNLQSIVTSANQLANNVYFIGSSTLLNALNATFGGDGTTTVFNTPLDVGAAPTITKNSVAQTVGILGVDTGKNWYWSQGSTAITQGTGSVLAATDTLVVSYLTATPAVAMAPNVGSLQQLQAIEGTSANYDYSTSITNPILPADLLALASGYEAEYGEPATTCQFYTLRPGLATGQLQNIALADAGIPSAAYLIATLQMTTLDGLIVWQYTAFGGANIGNALTQLTQFINRQQATLNIVTPVVPITDAGSAALVSGQNVAGNSNGGSPLAFPDPVTPGNLMVIVAERNSVLGNPPTVTDTLGSIWTQAIFAQTGGSFPNQISILYAFVPTPGGPNAIHCDSAEFFSIMEFTGIDTLAAPVVSGSNIGSAPGLTLPTANLLVVTGLAGVPSVPTATAPETVLSYHTDTTQPGVAMSVEIVASAGSFTSSLLSSGSGGTSVWASVAFTPPPATAPPAQTINVQGNGAGYVKGAGNLATVNAIPKVTSAGTLGDSSITDDGTEVYTSELLGVGTTTPLGQLHVVSPSSLGTSTLFERSNATSDVVWVGARMLASKTSTMGNGFGSGFWMGGRDTSGTIYSFAYLGGVRSGTPVGALGVGDMVMFTYSGSSGATEKMRVTHAGLVLIARTTDDGSGAILQVNGSINVPTGSSFLINGVPISGGSGGLVLLEEHTASSSAELDFTSWYSAAYDDYIIRLVGVIPATNNDPIELQFSTNGGSSYDATSGHYGWAQWGWVSGGASQAGNDGDTCIHLTDGVVTGVDYSASGSINLHNPGSGAMFTQLEGIVNSMTSGNYGAGFRAKGVTLGAAYLQVTAVNAFRILCPSGNIASGTVRIYGLTH